MSSFTLDKPIKCVVISNYTTRQAKAVLRECAICQMLPTESQIIDKTAS